MNSMFHQSIRNIALAVVLCVYAGRLFAQAAQIDWLDSIDQHAGATTQGQSELGIDRDKKALELAEKDLGPVHVEVARRLIALANSQMALGQYEEALLSRQRALAIKEATLGPEHFDNAMSHYELAETYGKLFQYEKALTHGQRGLAIIEKVYGLDDLVTAIGMEMLAWRYRDMGKYDDVLALQKRAVELREKAAHDDPGISKSLIELSETYGSLGRYVEELAYLQKALTSNDKPPIQDKVQRSEIFAHLGLTYFALAQYETALSMYQLAMDTRNKSGVKDERFTALMMLGKASVYKELAQYDKAVDLHQAVLAISQKLLGGADDVTAINLNNLAETSRALGLCDKAIPLLQQALNIDERTRGPEHLTTIGKSSNLALAYQCLAQYDKAVPMLEKAMMMHQKILGPLHPRTITSISNLANVYSAIGQYDKAWSLHQRALVLSEQAFDLAHPAVAHSLENLAGSFTDLSQFEKALPLLQRAISIKRTALGAEHPSTADSLGELAYTYSQLGQYDDALEQMLQALAIHVKVLGSEHPTVASSNRILAEILLKFGKPDMALVFAERSLQISEKVFGPLHPDTARSLNDVAVSYGLIGKHDDAIALLQRALAIYEQSLGISHPATALSLSNLAFQLFRTGQSDLAIAFFKSSVNILQDLRQQVSRIGALELRSYSGSVSHTYQDLAEVLVQQGRLTEAQLVLDMLKEEEQFEFIRRSTTSDPRSSRIGYNASEQVWMSRYRQIANQLAALGAEDVALQKLAKLGLNEQQKQRQKDLSADLHVAQKAFDAFLGEMRAGFAQQSAVRTVESEELSQKSMSDQQSLIKGLGNDVVLLRYYVTDDKVGMILSTAGVPLARSTKIGAKELNKQIFEFRGLLADRNSNPLPAAQALYTLLVAPVVRDLELAGAKTVMLSLDGALRHLPFAALHDGKRYLVNRWNLPMYTSVTKDRLRDDVTPQWQAAGFGVTRKWDKFPALPAVKNELNSVVKSAVGGVLHGEVYLDDAFTALTFKNVAARPFQLLHVASHFQFSPGTEVNSFLLLGDGQQLTLGDIRTQNYRFDNVDLLTLSACDTGLGGGRDERGREIEGFGVIAQQQGAKAVMATLWSVADQSTSTLMAETYRRRQEQHLTKIEALRQAQLSLLAQPRYAHPFYWAPFILMGNWK